MMTRSTVAVARRALVLATLLAAACDLPTSAPKVQTTWVIPIAGDSVSANSLLPAGVTVAADTLITSVPAYHGAHTLGQLCAPCTQPVYAPVPAFTGAVTDTVPLPANVQAVTLDAAVRIPVAVTHEFGFDPLHPSATAQGTLTLTLSANGAVLAADTVVGGAPWTRGSSLTLPLTVPAGATIAGPLTVRATIATPAGDPALIDPSAALDVDVPQVFIRAGSAVAQLQSQPLLPMHFSVDPSSVSPNARNRVQSGVLDLIVNNPVTASGTLSLNFVGNGAALIAPRTVALSGRAVDTLQVSFATADIQALLVRQLVQVTVTGTVSGSGADHLVSFRPGLTISVRPSLTVTTNF